MVNPVGHILQNLPTLKSYYQQFAAHRIVFNVPTVGRGCSICNKGRKPLPYTIVDATNKCICGGCATANNLPIASLWQKYEDSIEIPTCRIEKDETYPYTYLFYMGIPARFNFEREAVEWFARGMSNVTHKHSIDMVYYYCENGIEPVLSLGVSESTPGAREILERAESELLERVADGKKMFSANKVIFFYMIAAEEQPDEIPLVRLN